MGTEEIKIEKFLFDTAKSIFLHYNLFAAMHRDKFKKRKVSTLYDHALG